MYLSWDKKTISDFSADNINATYALGYLFTRLGKGAMIQTRSVRIDLASFQLSSENRRILKKTAGLTATSIQLSAFSYDWRIGKMAKDFYETKFGPGTFSANKAKELLTEPDKSNFNRLLVYKQSPSPLGEGRGEVGYAIALETPELIHYAYPFYDLKPNTYNLTPNPNTGLGMMLRAILYAQDSGKKFIYLGSAQRPSDTYKLQFSGLEWWDGVVWQTDGEKLKAVLKA